MSVLAWSLVATGGIVGALAAAKAGWLTRSGAVAATTLGAMIAFGLGLPGLAILVFFFVSSSSLTRWSRASGSATALDGDATGRGAGQVLANGGVAALGAVVAAGGPEDLGFLLAAGALGAATADTWASEVGLWFGGTTRLVTTWDRVEPGTNGGVSWSGTAAGLAGAMALGLVAGLALHDSGVFIPVAVGGAVGSVADSLIGATLEDRLAWINNDIVNALGTSCGAVTTGLIA